MRESFFTVAKGNKYLQLAFTLARSYHYHNTNKSFYIVSDTDYKLPFDLKWVNKKIVHPSLLENGVLFKLNFDKISPTDISIFIDSDSIIYDNVENLFQYAESINVIGNIVDEENDWLGLNLSEIKSKYKIENLVRYCGAFYIINKTATKTSLILEKAKGLINDSNLKTNHHTGFNEESILGLAMAMTNAKYVVDDGNIWSDLLQYDYNVNLNVFKGKPLFENIISKRKYKNWLPIGTYSPAILHIGSGIYNKSPWLFDSVRLKLHYKYKFPVRIANILTEALVVKPYFILKFIINLVKK
jgi:hypothetical protein